MKRLLPIWEEQGQGRIVADGRCGNGSALFPSLLGERIVSALRRSGKGALEFQFAEACGNKSCGFFILGTSCLAALIGRTAQSFDVG